MKNTIKLNEEQLRNIVAESVKRVLKEGLIDWSRVPGTKAYKNYQQKRSADMKRAHDDYEKYQGERDKKLQSRLANDAQQTAQNRNINANNYAITSRENQRRFKQSYNDPMGGRTGKSEKDYYGNDYGYVRQGSNNDDWKYGRR